jgi:hypothetical protein
VHPVDDLMGESHRRLGESDGGQAIEILLLGQCTSDAADVRAPFGPFGPLSWSSATTSTWCSTAAPWSGAPKPHYARAACRYAGLSWASITVPFLDQLSPVVPSRWGFAAEASTVDLRHLVPGALVPREPVLAAYLVGLAAAEASMAADGYQSLV